MTALSIPRSVRSIAVEPRGFSSGLFSAIRKVAAKVNEVEPRREQTQQAQAAALANPLLREHACVCSTL